MDRLKEVAWVDDYGRIVFKDGTSLTPNAEHVEIGKGTALSPDLVIGLPNKPVSLFRVGDNCRIFAGKIAPRIFKCGDYVTIHEGVWAYGRRDITIGHNAWFGMRCTLDAEGDFRVGNGFGAGQDTHLWSHIRHGDVLAGCQYLSFGSFIAEDDVWFVGRCTSAPAYHEKFSVALTESNVTKGMGYNTVWGGNPAKDLTEKIGAPYRNLDSVDRLTLFHQRVSNFLDMNPDIDIDEMREVVSRFNITERTYAKQGDPLEVRFMRYLLPEAKFVPQ